MRRRKGYPCLVEWDNDLVDEMGTILPKGV
jgi:hypothetical protein